MLTHVYVYHYLSIPNTHMYIQLQYLPFNLHVYVHTHSVTHILIHVYMYIPNHRVTVKVGTQKPGMEWNRMNFKENVCVILL